MMQKNFLVIDLADVQQSLVKEDLAIFTEHQKLIEANREARGLSPKAAFILCAVEEPYAQLVAEIIRQGDAVKQAHRMLSLLTQQLNAMTTAAAVQDEGEPKELDLGETRDPDHE